MVTLTLTVAPSTSTAAWLLIFTDIAIDWCGWYTVLSILHTSQWVCGEGVVHSESECVGGIRVSVWYSVRVSVWAVAYVELRRMSPRWIQKKVLTEPEAVCVSGWLVVLLWHSGPSNTTSGVSPCVGVCGHMCGVGVGLTASRGSRGKPELSMKAPMEYLMTASHTRPESWSSWRQWNTPSGWQVKGQL